MSFYIYSLSEPEVVAALAWPPGIVGARVEIFEHAGLALIISQIEQLPAPVRWADLRAHDAVNRAVLDGGVCVPLRYGTMFSTQQELGELIGGRIGYWQQAVERVRGHVEISIKGLLPPPPKTMVAEHTSVANPGTAFLQQRRARLEAEQDLMERSKQLVNELRHELGLSADAVVIDARGRLIDVAVLIRRELYAGAATHLGTRIQTLPGRWSVGAPWPPYSFVVAPEEQTREERD